MVLFISPLLELYPTYAKWQPAIPRFNFFTLSIGWSSISSPLTTALTAIGQINYTLKLMVIWTILTWVLSPLLLIWYGFSGIAAAALLISFSSILSVWYVKRFVDLRVWEQVWRQLFAVLAMAVLGILGGSFWMRSIWWLLLGMGLTAGTYGAVLLLVGKTVVFSQIRSLLAVRTEKYTNTE